MERRDGSMLVNEVLQILQEALRVLQADRFMPMREAAEYVGMKPRKLREILPEHLLFRISSKKILVKKSELDQVLEQYRQSPERNLSEIAEDALKTVLGSET